MVTTKTKRTRKGTAAPADKPQLKRANETKPRQRQRPQQGDLMDVGHPYEKTLTRAGNKLLDAMAETKEAKKREDALRLDIAVQMKKAQLPVYRKNGIVILVVDRAKTIKVARTKPKTKKGADDNVEFENDE